MMKKVGLVFISLFVMLQLQAQREIGIEDCRQMALKNNKSLQITNENLNAARELKKAAFTQFLPNFSANGTYMHNQKSPSLLAEDAMLPVGTKMPDGSFGFTPEQVTNSWTLIDGQPIPLDANQMPFNPKTNPEKVAWKNHALLPKESMEFDMRNVFAGSVGFIQPVFMGGKIVELYRMAKYGENLASAQQESKTTELLLEVDEAYWRVISLNSKVKLAHEYKNLIAKVDTNISIMMEEGLATKAEALKVRVKLNEAEMTISKAENGLSLSKMALNQLCGFEIEEDDTYSDDGLDSDQVTELISTENALANRPEIKALTQVENMAKSNEKIMLSRFMPNVVMAGNYIVSNPNVFNGYQKDFAGMFNVGIVASVPLFHFGDKFHTLNAAKSQRKIASMEIEQAKEKMQLQIQQNSYRLAESMKMKIATQKSIEHASESLRYASEGFNEGVITSTDLLAAQTMWLSAQSENIDANISFKLCNLYLAKSLGTLK